MKKLKTLICDLLIKGLKLLDREKFMYIDPYFKNIVINQEYFFCEEKKVNIIFDTNTDECFRFGYRGSINNAKEKIATCLGASIGPYIKYEIIHHEFDEKAEVIGSIYLLKKR
jgi:hypothetical protein